MFPKNSHIEALTPKVTAFGDEAYKEKIKVKWNHKDSPSSNETGIL